MKRKTIFRKFVLVLAAVMFSATAMAQIKASGVVTDESGEPIIGASILEAGTTNGTISDFDGNFELTTAASAKLQVSFMGYQSQEVAAKSNLVIVLKEDTYTLTEVVAIGYGSQKKKEITGSVASVKSENFNPGVKESPMGLLQGKVAGLTVTRTGGGDPTNTGFAVQIRGTSSLGQGTGSTPLYIVDGIPVNNIDNIAPEDIESMDVLKDGSSAAIYGTRGTNGVIIITTKRGSNSGEAECGKVSVDYAGYVSFSTDASNQQMATADQFRQLSDATNTWCSGVDMGGSTDWVKALMRDFAFTHNHNLAISGATKNFSYRGSVNFKDAQGIAQTSNRREIMAKLAANQKAFEGWLDLQYDFSYMHYRNDYFCGSFDNAAALNPTYSIYEADGSYSKPKLGSNTTNPVADMNEKEAYQDGNFFRGSVRATVNIKAVPGLKVNGFAALEEADNYDYWSNPKDYYIAKDANKAGRKTSRNFNQLYEGTIDYANGWDGHNVAAVLGASYQNFWSDGSEMSNGGFAQDGIKYYMIGSGDVDKELMTISSWRNSNTLIAFFGRVNYNYDEKYLLSASLRREGSSRMGANNKWGWFPAASAGWRISGEDFMRDQDWCNDLKLRLGFGITGNNLNSDLKSVEMLTTDGSTFNNHGVIDYAYQVNQNANPDLKWERKFEYNVGIDFSFLTNRLSGTIDLYYRKTRDLLWYYNVPSPPYQTTTLLANAGEMHSKGLEFSLTGIPVKTKNWNWESTITMAFNANKIDKLSDPDLGFNYDEKLSGSIGGIGISDMNTQIIIANQAVGAFYGYKWTGQYDENRKLIYEDINGDGEINENDRTIIGSAQPLFNFGWNNTIRYKNWDLSLFFRGVVGNKVLNLTRMCYAPGKNTNSTNVFWRDAEEFGTYTYKQNDKFSDYWLEDGSYLKLDNITLGYKVPLKANKFCQGLRVYFTAQNVFTITGYSGKDPEIDYSGIDSPGIDYVSFYPSVRSFLIGVNANF